ncbi:uncharacterized protein BX664DRAFT_321301 [Halteromyces radiatus]|uniref:uncharacterized protein n=1 Tax=Halteromyces radiatus TaxID=101107 RepID=UPI00221EC1BA|nr:uncharacterized protein BX664DRAFT_321301 [Halteromyces radiatus]KAI8099464.1 hypothetical protein BX664DRAFT_321301 [Halteromyces radiatus]
MKSSYIVGATSLTGTFAIGVYYFLQHRQWILSVIQQFALDMRTNIYGPFILAGIIALMSTPPILGFTFMVMMTGFVYDFPKGLLPAVSGAFVGSLICFGLIRRLGMDRFIPMSTSQQKKYQAMQGAIQDGGWKMMILIRICPIPWQFTNMFLSLMPTVTLQDYIWTGLIASWKVTIEVWAGSQLANLSDASLPPSARRLTLITLIIGLVILAGVIRWLYQLTMRKMDKIKNS